MDISGRHAVDGPVVSTMRHMELFCRESAMEGGIAKGPKNALIAPQSIYFPKDFQGPDLETQKSLITYVTKMFYQETGARISVKEKASPNRANKRIRYRCRNTKCQFRFQMNLDEGKAATSCEENRNLWFIPQGTGNFQHSFEDCFCAPVCSSSTFYRAESVGDSSAFQLPRRGAEASPSTSTSTLHPFMFSDSAAAMNRSASTDQHQDDSHPRRVSPTHSLESSPMLAHAAWGQLPFHLSHATTTSTPRSPLGLHDFMSVATMPYQQLSTSQILQALGGANAAAFALPTAFQQNPLYQESSSSLDDSSQSSSGNPQPVGEGSNQSQEESITVVTPASETSDSESESSSPLRKRSSRVSSLGEGSSSDTNNDAEDVQGMKSRSNSLNESSTRTAPEAEKEKSISDLEVNALAALMGLQRDSTIQ